MPSTNPAQRQPVLFLGHGSPMNAIEDNRWSRAFQALGTELRETVAPPRAVLCISAHWFIEETALTSEAAPKTIHDFGGFPRELYEVEYPAPGDHALAEEIANLLGKEASLRTDWGLDHGTWSVLRHLFPKAEVPVLQLSIDANKSPLEHLALAKKLSPLRDANVLIAGSGNLTHNLRYAMQSRQRGDTSTPDWAARFDAEISRAISERDDEALTRALSTSDGRMSHPSPDHFLPILYSYGASDARDLPGYPIAGFDLGSLSMRSVIWHSQA